MGKGRRDPDAWERGLGLLTRREHSRRELGRKLRARGVEGDEAEEVLDRLEAHDFQSDERFAGMLVRQRVSGGYGPVRIRAELAAQHGLDDEAIEAALAEEVDAAGIDWADQAARQLQRRYGDRPVADPADRNKRLQFLLRRGFPMDIALAALA